MSGEAQRYSPGRVHRILDNLPDRAYDDVVHLATQLCDAPMAVVALMDQRRVWRKAARGLPDDPMSVERKGTFLGRVADNPTDVTVVEDARLDSYLATHPYVSGELGVRMIAGAPIVAADGEVVGAVAVMDNRVRGIATGICTALQCLARQLTLMLEVRQRGELEADEVFRENQYLQALAYTGLDLQSVIDLEYRYRYANQVYLDHWNLQLEEIEGRPITEYIDKQRFLERVKPHIDRAMAGEQVTLDTELEFPSKGKRHVRIRYLPARDQSGSIIGVVRRIEDISDLKEVELSLRHTVHMLEEKKQDLQRFIHILSHDLREPVNTIMNFSGLLREQLAETGSDQVRRFLEFVYKGGDRMRSLLDDLLKYVRVDGNAPEKVSVSLDELLQEIRQDLDAALVRTQAEVVCQSLPVVQGDRHMLRVLLQNLLENAIKFVKPGVRPEVQVSANSTTEGWEVMVLDNGVGIREDQRELVFDLFKRLHSRRQYDGTGLGLATCRRIAELHGGRIWVSQPSQPGSCFHVFLPRK